MAEPVLLDLFCGAGGCSAGYARAGFRVVGVDHVPQPNYPFEFVRADALEYLARRGSGYDAIHASPPCQRYSACATMPRRSRERYPDLLGRTRRALDDLGRPYVIENVPGAPLGCGVTLCGMMFGLRVFRHRVFESSLCLLAPPHPRHRAVIHSATRPCWVRCACCENYWCQAHAAHVHDCPCPPVEEWPVDPYAAGGGRKTLAQWNTLDRCEFITVAGNLFRVAEGREAMRIDWPMTRREVANAIPPAYTEFIGKQLLRALEGNSCTTS